MSKLKVYDMKGSAVGEMDWADKLLVQNKGSQAVHDAVVAILAGRRGGNASTLRKGEVAGSNKKPWKQKGTGRARAGYRQSPVWRGGGVAFGPHPRSYEQKINKKVGRLAFVRALSDRIKNDEVKVLGDFSVPDGKTKAIMSLLKSLQVTPPVLFVVDKVEKKAVQAVRNIPGVEIARAKDVSVYQLVRYPLMIATRAGLEDLRARIGDSVEGAV